MGLTVAEAQLECRSRGGARGVNDPIARGAQ
jgi:hypothetical protein